MLFFILFLTKFIIKKMILLLIFCFFSKTLSISTNNTEIFELPKYTYTQFIKTTALLLESEYEAGQVRQNLLISEGIKEEK